MDEDIIPLYQIDNFMMSVFRMYINKITKDLNYSYNTYKFNYKILTPKPRNLIMYKYICR